MKSEIKTKDGSHITIEGTEEEILKVIKAVTEQETNRSEPAKQENEVKKKNGAVSIGDQILELKEEKFFDSPRSLSEIKHALAQKGRIYEITTLSTQVLRLVRKHSLGRVKTENKWGYVKR